MEGRLEAVMQHDGKTNAHNAAEPPNAAPARLLAGRRASSRAVNRSILASSPTTEGDGSRGPLPTLESCFSH